MTDITTSIVIAVFNKWELTRNCLQSLYDTLPPGECEVIVIDNGSSDETRAACPEFGNSLFAGDFKYLRSETNLNFGPASNLGARLARGRFLLLLNNDTIALPGWYEPLLRDFEEFPDIAATGPVLLYPGSGPLGDTVQHLGVAVMPAYDLCHLYEGIPAASPLTETRRFFQAITAACLLLPRRLLLEHGGFDKAYINGFEDVDLCARLWKAGYRMTVNPRARMYHLTSQSPGRHDHEEHNAALLQRTTLLHLTPDVHLHLAKDNLEFGVSDWGTLIPQSAPILPESQFRPAGLGDREIVAELERSPLRFAGYEELVARSLGTGDFAAAHSVLLSLSKIKPAPGVFLQLLRTAAETGDRAGGGFAMTALAQYCLPCDLYVETVAKTQKWLMDIGLEPLALKLEGWLLHKEKFEREAYPDLIRAMGEYARPRQVAPDEVWAYCVWAELKRHALESASVAGPSEDLPRICFSILMPVYNPAEEYLRAAVDSVLAQTWPHWELCLADDASPDPAVRPLLLELAGLDERIKVRFREQNGHIAAATNTALEMAGGDFAALLDQDDLLTADALSEVALALKKNPSAKLVYSDEDKCDAGQLLHPYFKNAAWDRELLTGQNLVNHLGVYQIARLRELGGFRDGFPGAQDYDLLLRFTEDLADAEIVHIPKVLYHWRMHADSTAMSVDSKPEALLSTVKALEDYLRRNGLAGSAEIVPGTQAARLCYALPSPAPLVTLVFDIGAAFSLAEAFMEKVLPGISYKKLEVLLLCDEEADPRRKRAFERQLPPRVRLLEVPSGLKFAGKLERLRGQAHGRVIGFLGLKIVPATDGWLEEIVSRLLRPGVGVIGGVILNKKGRVLHAGYSVDADKNLFTLFRGNKHSHPGYFLWARLARTVTAVDPRCFFTRSELLLNSEFPCAAGEEALVSHCLSLQEQGWRTVITPSASFLLLSDEIDAPWETNGVVRDAQFLRDWQSRLVPVNPNLCLAANWSLNWNFLNGPADEETLFESYTRLKDIRILFDHVWYAETYLKKTASFEEALRHYLRRGRKNLFKPHPLFFADTYRSLHLSGNHQQDIDPLKHYIDIGSKHNFSACPLLDEAWYRDRYMTANDEQSPLAHYISIGAPARFRPNAFFDAAGYEKEFAAEMEKYRYALLHFAATSLELKHNPGEGFDAAYYLREYPDVAASGTEPLTHFLLHGRREGRLAEQPRLDYRKFGKLASEKLAARPDNKIIVCTAIAGNYSKLLPPPHINPAYRYVCFSDGPQPDYGIWEILPMPFEDADPTRKARYCKLHLPDLFPEADRVVWVDGNVLIQQDLADEIEAVGRADSPIGLIRHPFRDCIYDEAAACLDAGKDDERLITRQSCVYRSEGLPKSLGLYETNLMIVNRRHRQAAELFRRWWAECARFSRRDQLSLPYVLWKTGCKPSILLGGDSVRTHAGFAYLPHRATFSIVVPGFDS